MRGHAISTVLTTNRCMASYICRYLVRKSGVYDEQSLAILEFITSGKITETAHIRFVYNILSSSDFQVDFTGCEMGCRISS